MNLDRSFMLIAPWQAAPVLRVGGNAIRARLPSVISFVMRRAKNGAAQDWAKSEETEADGTDSYFRTRSVPDAEG